MSATEKKRILVIGAGVAGLSCIKACKEAGLEVVCYEKDGEWGGLWHYRDQSADEGVPSVMKATVSNASKEMSAFSDFPPSAEFPSFLSHEFVMKYLESYAEQFDLLGCITYFQEILELIPGAEYGSTGEWLVKIRHTHTGEVREETFSGVAVCTGHHAFPSTPSYPNMDLFSGRIMHSHGYKSFTGMEDKNVLVVGAGNSGADIAVEVSNVAKKVYLSTRRGTWIFPRLFHKGKPYDTCLIRRSKALLPASLFSKQVKNLLNSYMDHGRFGIRPFHPVLSQHPTVNDELGARMLTGRIMLRRDIKDFSAEGVLFDGDDQFTQVDVVVFATGFLIKFPFLSDDILRVGKNNKVFLYKNMFPPQLKHHTLALIGLVQPSGSLFPVFEMQSRWFSALQAGTCRGLPSPDEMLTEARLTEGQRTRSYVQSPRHSIDVPWMQYMDDVASQIGVKPNLASMLFTDPKLFQACMFGPCLPYQYRLSGPEKWSGAREAILSYKKRLFQHLQKCE